MASGMEIEGIDELISKLNSMGQNVSKLEKDILEYASEPLAKEMKNLVHVSGKHAAYYKHIRDDIQISKVQEKDGVKFIEVGPGKKTNWRAKFLEWGTSKMSAHPFAQPAFEKSKPTVLDRMKQKLKEVLRI